MRGDPGAAVGHCGDVVSQGSRRHRQTGNVFVVSMLALGASGAYIGFSKHQTFRMLARGGVSGTQRIARHLGRMCFGLFIATGSFFLGRQQIFPVVFRTTYLLVLLAVLPLMLMIFWLIRNRRYPWSFRESYRSAAESISVPTT